MNGGRTEGGALISRIHQICGRVWFSVLKKHGMETLSGARGRVIFALWMEDGVPIRALSEKTGIGKAALTGILSRLERDGFVTRSTDSGDRRSTLIFLTGKDKPLRTRIARASSEMNAVFYRGFSKAEISAFEEQLRRILQNCRDAESGRNAVF